MQPASEATLYEPSPTLDPTRLHALRLLAQPSEIRTVVLLKTDVLFLLDALEKKQFHKGVGRQQSEQLSLF